MWSKKCTFAKSAILNFAKITHYNNYDKYEYDIYAFHTHRGTGTADPAHLTVVLLRIDRRPLGEEVLLSSGRLLLDVASHHALLLTGQRLSSGLGTSLGYKHQFVVLDISHVTKNIYHYPHTDNTAFDKEIFLVLGSNFFLPFGRPACCRQNSSW